VAGVASARLLGKLAEAQLFQVKTDDPVTLAAAAATVLAAALLASWWPARHAARVDPIIVLKAE
jgi:ABC-type lipoprotein release transport system permease subunit